MKVLDPTKPEEIFDFAAELARSMVPKRIDECAKCSAPVSPDEHDWLCAACRYEPPDEDDDRYGDWD